MRFVDTLRDRVGDELILSDWFEIRQADIDVFSAITHDWDYMHNDPEWARTGPWGTTIAHGYFLVSLIAHFQCQAGFPTVATDDEMVINYGLDRVRFTEPVRIGDRIRARLVLQGLEERRPGEELVRVRVTYESDRSPRPHMIADVLSLCVYGEAISPSRVSKDDTCSPSK